MRVWGAMVVAGGLIAACAGMGLAAERMPVGAVERVQARAEAMYGDNARLLAIEDTVLFRDILRTGAQARLLAELADGTQLTLGENAQVYVDEFVYAPAGESNQLALRVLTGAFLFVGGAVEDAADAQVSIATPVGTLGIRGTTVWGGRIDGGYGVLVLDGEVEVRTLGGVVTLQSGQATMIDRSGAVPEAAHRWDEAKTARAVATISFAD